MTKKLFEIVISNSNSSYPVQYNQTQYLNHNFKMLLQIYTHVKPGAHSRINANAHASLPCFIEVKMADVGENLDSSSSEDEEVLLCFAILTSIKHGKDACAFALIPELIAQNARTLWVNVHSCTKLFNMLNILSSWHAWQKSQNMTPHTWGNSLRQQPRVTLSSADSSSVRGA